MNEPIFDQIQESAKYLGIDLYTQELAAYAVDSGMSPESIEDLRNVFEYLQQKKNERIVTTLLKMSRMPQKEPKTFEGYDFSRVSGKDADALKNLPALSAVYAHRNIAFIGPPGLGKTHLAMAYGRECCKQGMKTYFLKATELNQKLATARRSGRVGPTVNGLVKPSCLIIDEIGRCVFDKENTRIFFDIIDRRYNKEGPNCMIFTSNKSPNEWRPYFQDDDSLLSSLDRLFDNAAVFVMKGDSYRGRKLETYAVEAGILKRP